VTSWKMIYQKMNAVRLLSGCIWSRSTARRLRCTASDTSSNRAASSADGKRITWRQRCDVRLASDRAPRMRERQSLFDCRSLSNKMIHPLCQLHPYSGRSPRFTRGRCLFANVVYWRCRTSVRLR
jgi:hypothetical protein